VRWDLLVCSIAHRTEMLTELLGEFARQRAELENPASVSVIVFRDNLQTEYGAKCQALLEASTADYVSWFDDDDWPAPDFMASVLEALEEQPDYVGFKVRYTEDGVPQVPVYHTLRYSGWVNNPEALYRDIVHFNPIRRDLALRGRWEGGDGADRRWADQLRALGCVREEVFIDRELHHYRHRPADTFTVASLRAPLEQPPEAPLAPPWVRWLT